MAQLPNKCPACAEPLEVARLDCPGCAMHIEGRFALPELHRLSPEDQDFVLAFVRASGSLKAMGKRLKVSYPTVRNRLDELIAKLGTAEATAETRRRKLLDAVAGGELTVKEAVKRLKEIA